MDTILNTNAVFEGCTVCVHLVPVGTVQTLLAAVKAAGGTRSFGVTAATTHVVCSKTAFEKDRGSAARNLAAAKAGIPIVTPEWVFRSVAEGKLCDITPYQLVVAAAQRSPGLVRRHGVSSQADFAKRATTPPAPLTLASAGQCGSHEVKFPETATMLASHYLESSSGDAVTYSLEGTTATRIPMFRVKQHLHGNGERKYCYHPDIGVLEKLYCKLLQADTRRRVVQLSHVPVSKSSATIEFAQLSRLLLAAQSETTSSIDALGAGVVQLANVEKAECVALEALALMASGEHAGVSSLHQEFLREVPFVVHDPWTSAASVSRYLDRCQLLRDSLALSEALVGGTNDADAIYRALHSDISLLDAESDERKRVLSQLGDVTRGGTVHVYRVARYQSSDDFQYEIRPNQLLFHGTKATNVLGILNRGMLLPKVVTDRLGVQRSDYGFLGSGLYFSPSAELSLRYAQSGSSGHHVMFLCRVATGRSYTTTEKLPHLTAAPAGYHSVVGVPSGGEDSSFEAEEVVVYSSQQVRIEYMVDIVDAAVDRGAVAAPAAAGGIPRLPCADVLTSSRASKSALRTVAPPVHQTPRPDDGKPNVQQSGLISSSGRPMPLVSMHVRANILDLACEVVVLQEFVNDTSDFVEAKFVFPVTGSAGVNSFEAHINGKRIVGRVKDKAVAHKEYKEAIDAGKGAYLMDQDKEDADVFTVSVGNLPPSCTAVIRVTYVAELKMDSADGAVLFTLPASMSAQRARMALTDRTQTAVRTVAGTSGAGQAVFSLQIVAEMAFTIASVCSPTHHIQTKRVGRKAVCKLAGDDGGMLKQDFELRLLMTMPHASRMWIEDDPSKQNPPAAMVAFYPRLKAESSDRIVNWIIMDNSASMAEGGAKTIASQVLPVLLHHLGSRRCHAQCTVFGSVNEDLAAAPIKLSPHVAHAISAAYAGLEETWGGSDLLTPLHRIVERFRLQRQSTGSGAPPLVNIFLISDTRTEQCIQQCLTLLRGALEACGVRLFVIAVGESLNAHTARSLARAGAGAVELIKNARPAAIERSCQLQARRSRQPAVGDISVEWELGTRGGEAKQAPASVTTVFSGERCIVYAFADHCQRATLRGTYTGTDGRTRSFSTHVSPHATGKLRGHLLHTLAAREMIKDWDSGCYDDVAEQHLLVQRRQKEKLIELSCRYQVVTKWTSFVAIEERSQEEQQQLAEGNAQAGVAIQELVDADTRDNLSTVPWSTVRRPEASLAHADVQSNLGAVSADCDDSSSGSSSSSGGDNDSESSRGGSDDVSLMDDDDDCAFEAEPWEDSKIEEPTAMPSLAPTSNKRKGSKSDLTNAAQRSRSSLITTEETCNMESTRRSKSRRLMLKRRPKPAAAMSPPRAKGLRINPAGSRGRGRGSSVPMGQLREEGRLRAGKAEKGKTKKRRVRNARDRPVASAPRQHQQLAPPPRSVMQMAVAPERLSKASQPQRPRSTQRASRKRVKEAESVAPSLACAPVPPPPPPGAWSMNYAEPPRAPVVVMASPALLGAAERCGAAAAVGGGTWGDQFFAEAAQLDELCCSIIENEEEMEDMPCDLQHVTAPNDSEADAFFTAAFAADCRAHAPYKLRVSEEATAGHFRTDSSGAWLWAATSSVPITATCTQPISNMAKRYMEVFLADLGNTSRVNIGLTAHHGSGSSAGALVMTLNPLTGGLEHHGQLLPDSCKGLPHCPTRAVRSGDCIGFGFLGQDSPAPCVFTTLNGRLRGLYDCRGLEEDLRSLAVGVEICSGGACLSLPQMPRFDASRLCVPQPFKISPDTIQQTFTGLLAAEADVPRAVWEALGITEKHRQGITARIDSSEHAQMVWLIAYLIHAAEQCCPAPGIHYNTATAAQRLCPSGQHSSGHLGLGSNWEDTGMKLMVQCSTLPAFANYRLQQGVSYL